MRRTKIVCTIGPASSSAAELDRLVTAGLDVARLNFSHGTHEEHAEVIERIRAGDARWGRPFTLCARPVVGTVEQASITHPEYLKDLRAGDEIWMDDGMIQLRVETTT